MYCRIENIYYLCFVNFLIFNNMKRISLLIMSVVALCAIAFVGCEKENHENAASNLQQFSQVSLFDEAMFLKSEGQYDDYVKKLGEATGIDIEEISMLPSIMEFSQINVNVINCSFTRGALTEAKMEKIKYYNSKIQEANGYDNYELVLQYYDSLCAVCRTIDGFVLGTSEYGLDTISFDENTLALPINEMNTYMELCENIECELSTRDNYNSLTNEEQKEVKVAAMYVGIMNAYMTPKMCETYEGCLNQAAGKRAVAIAQASVEFSAGAATTCAALARLGTLPGVACIAAFMAKYASDVADAQGNYKRDVELCNYKYGRS